MPPNAYTPSARYERVIEAFGGRGFFVSTPEELRKALQEAARETMPTLINVMINPQSTRKPQKFDWLTR